MGRLTERGKNMSIPHSRPSTDETAVELALPRHTVIQRLQQLQGPCSVSDSNEDRLEFTCSAKGHFWIDNVPTRSRHQAILPYYVAGEVVEENGKTVVTFRAVRRRGSKAVLAVMLVADLLLILSCFLFSLTKRAMLLLAFLMGSLTVSSVLSFGKKESHCATDTELMKQEVLNRIEAVKRWEE